MDRLQRAKLCSDPISLNQYRQPLAFAAGAAFLLTRAREKWRYHEKDERQHHENAENSDDS